MYVKIVAIFILKLLLYLLLNECFSIFCTQAFC